MPVVLVLLRSAAVKSDENSESSGPLQTPTFT